MLSASRDVIEDAAGGEKAEAIAELKDEKSWPVTIGYFDNIITDSTEAMPVYQVSFLLYEGGISRKLIDDLSRLFDHRLAGFPGNAGRISLHNEELSGQTGS